MQPSDSYREKHGEFPRNTGAVSGEQRWGEHGKSSVVVKLDVPGGSEKLHSLGKGIYGNCQRGRGAELGGTYPAVRRLEAQVGGHLHVGAAQGEDAQAEIQELQRQQRDPGVALLRGTGIGLQSQDWATSADSSHFTQGL